MAKIKGTNGDDTLVGTSGDDIINSLLGIDSVDGGAGYDVLTIDYGAVEGSVFPGSVTVNDDGTLSGGISSGVFGAPNATGFENVERLVYTGSQDIDYITVNLGTLAFSAKRLVMDGGAGDDVLVLNASQNASGMSFTAAENGLIGSNVGNFANWEAFDIALGYGKPNTITTGAGDDRVTSQAVGDQIDLGAGTDTWSGRYGDFSKTIKLTYSDATGVEAITGAKTLVTVANAEVLDVTLGYGGDKVTMTDGAGSISGGYGNDTLTYATTAKAIDVAVVVGADGDLSGTIAETIDPTPLGVREFETVVVRGGKGANSFTFDGSENLVAYDSSSWRFVGGRSSDTLTLDLRGQGGSYIGEYEGRSFVEAGFTSHRYLEWSAIETLTVRFGNGTNNISGSSAQSITVYGGTGRDSLDFAFGGTPVVFDLGSSDAQATGGAIVTIQDVEGVRGSAYTDTLIDSAAANTINGYLGDDFIYAGGGSADGVDEFDGGDGTDLINYVLAGSAVSISLALTGEQYTGGGGSVILTGFENLTGSGYADVLTGNDGANVIRGVGGDDVIEGLGGNDTLDGEGGINTISYARAAAAVTVSLATGQATGGAGSDTLANFANLIGSGYADTLTGDANANVLTGGRGADTLTGGGGADTFVFTSKLDSPNSGYDSITDFTRTAGDKIDLRAIDAIEASPRFNDAFTYIGGNAFSGAAGELRVAAARGGGWFVYGDTNGDAVADLTIYVDGAQPPLPADILL